MEIDSLLMFDDGVAITTTRESEKTLDFLAAGDEIDKSFSLVVQGHVLVGEGKFQVDVETSDKPSSGFVKLASFAQIAAADANKTGYVLRHAIIPYGVKQYLRLKYNVSGSISGGTIDAFLTRSREIQ